MIGSALTEERTTRIEVAPPPSRVLEVSRSKVASGGSSSSTMSRVTLFPAPMVAPVGVARVSVTVSRSSSSGSEVRLMVIVPIDDPAGIVSGEAETM